MSSVPVIIIGTSGQVAQALRSEIHKEGQLIWSTSRNPKRGDATQFFLDLGDKKSIENFFQNFSQKFPGIATEVYLPGAMTHVDRCEQEQDLCKKLNVDGPVVVAELCEKYGHRLCYFSSEYVYGAAEYCGGKVGPFSESDAPSPSCYYGKSKLDAENALLARKNNSFILVVRTTMVFSYEVKGMNFVMQVLRHLERWKQGDHSQSFRVPVDQISTPTYAKALAQASIQLMQKKCSGIYHVVGRDLLSRKEFIEKILQEFSYPKEALQSFQFLPTKELGQVAKRPLTAGLNTAKAEQEDIRIWSLQDAFRDFKEQMK